MDISQLREDFDAARQQVRDYQSRNVDQGTMTAAIDRAKNLKARLDRAQGDANQTAEIARLTGGPSGPSFGRGSSPGAQFVASDLYKQIRANKNNRIGVWQSEAVEVGGFDLHATTVDESGGSGGPILIPDYQPGILPLPTRKLVVADLFAQGVTSSNLITYMKETTFTNAATAVAEGTAKPESTLIFTAASDAVKKLAHWVPATEEILDDVGQMRSYIDSRLRIGVQLAEDDGLINGNGIGANFNGVLARAGLAAAVARGADSNVDAIAKQISAIETATLLPVDGIILHPSNWLSIQLMKSSTGEYLASAGPFAPFRIATLWGRAVAITPTITVNTALVGAFKTGAEIFRNGFLRVDVSNSHSDFFTKNLVAIRGEQREALCVYRSSAFGSVTGLN